MNPLVHRSEFEAILKDYHPSPQAMAILKQMRLVLLSGPSAAGRNSVMELLVRDGQYQQIISDTTRKPRTNNGIKEQNGSSYWFRSEEEFLHDLAVGSYLEAEIIHDRQVSGISMRELIKAHDIAKIAINEVEIGGFLHLLNLKPDTIAIFLIPPDFQTWLDRLINRGKMVEDELISRINTGIRVFIEAKNLKQAHIVINHTLDQTRGDIENIVNQRPYDIASKNILDDLIIDAKAYLRTKQG